MKKSSYDIIILGAGMAGTSLLYRALKAGLWNDKSIALIDKNHSNKAEKTWCFWEDKQGPFEALCYKHWQNFNFYNNQGQHLLLNSQAYNYKMLRSEDFYDNCYSFFKSCTNIHFIEDEIVKHYNTNNEAIAESKKNTYSCQLLFNSNYVKPTLKQGENYFLQHFKGWFIESEKAVFDSNSIHFMDFRPSQKNGCTFMYVLPLSDKKALVEYTLFTKKLLSDAEYSNALKTYIAETLKLSNYTIYKEEFGVIPMTDHCFERSNDNIINIGSIGGDTRASTGYTFQNTQKTVSNIINHYQKNGLDSMASFPKNKKESLLDSTFLKVFDNGKYPPHQIFSDLFFKCDAQKIFRFLDGNSSATDDLSVMKSLDAKYFILPFFKAIKQRLINK